ncbi:MAG TPA: pitrilysin family protein [Candidatus Pacearchaeota archaeon]|nr:pitrilysin family protein [Candidatus Pacearchaeota archaeon]
MFKKTILKNGLRIVTVPEKSAKAATVLVVVGAGSEYERKDLSGLSHFLEHMFFKGTKKLEKPKDVAEFLDRVGGDFNAFTGEEYTGYYAKVNAEHLDIALSWVSDIFLNSRIPAQEIEKERGVIIEELHMYNDNPQMHISQLWKEVFYGDQPAGWDIGGTKETVSKIKRQDILNYISSQYTSENTVVCVAGKINEREIIEKVEKLFRSIKKGKANPKFKTEERKKESRVLIDQRKTKQVNVALGVKAYDLFHEERIAASLLAIILGGMMSSRLFIKVREKLGAAYYVRTINESMIDSGWLCTFAGVDQAKLFPVIQTIVKEYGKMAKQKIGQEELKKAKDYFKGKMILSLESSDDKATHFGLQELLMNKILTIEEVFAKIDKVSSLDLQKAAKEMFQEENLNLALIGPLKEEKQFKKLLKL